MHSLIMTPDTASSRAAMRAEVPTDRPSARWESEGCGGSDVDGGSARKTTAFHSLLSSPPRRSINIHFAALIPNLINDVKAMTQQSLGAVTAGACQFLLVAVAAEGRSHFICLRRRNKSAHREPPY